jgi:hypothetical protein
VVMDVQLGGGEDQLALMTHVTLGKGAHGRVVEGVYRGQRVAVKLLDIASLAAYQPPREPAAPPGSSVALAAAAAGPLGELGGGQAVVPGQGPLHGADLAAAQAREQGAGRGPSLARGPDEDKDKGKEQEKDALRYLEALVQEAAVLGRALHPNIVRLLAANLL